MQRMSYSQTLSIVDTCSSAVGPRTNIIIDVDSLSLCIFDLALGEQADTHETNKWEAVRRRRVSRTNINNKLM